MRFHGWVTIAAVLLVASAAPAADDTGATTKPATTKPATTKPATTKPATTKPAISKPAATRPATRRSDGGAARTAIQSAISELTKEFQASLRKSASPPRTQSDYFTENPSDDVTPEAVAAVLARSSDGDPRLQAYVKWQLLSALP